MKPDRNEGNCIRPKNSSNDALADEMDTSDEEGEERRVKGQKIVHQPSKEEWDDHMRTHAVFRKWCPFCVEGKCRAGAHKRTEKSEEELEQETPVISLDYMGPKSGEDKAQKITSLPIIVGFDRKKKWYFAHMAPKKDMTPMQSR